MIASDQQLRDNAWHELHMMRTTLGKENINTIVRITNSIHNAMFVKTGIIGSLQNKTTHEDERRDAGHTMGKGFYTFTTTMNNYLLSMITMLYITILRLVMIAQWLPLTLPFLAAAAVDGVAQNKILHASVAVSNPVKLKLALHVLIACMALPLLYLISPFAIPPYFMLVFMIASAFPLMFLISEMAPMSYR